jgi:hypothetical protein
MTKQQALNIVVAQLLFESYPTVSEFYVTTDGQAFVNNTDAEAHANFLDKKNAAVQNVKRADLEEKAADAENKKPEVDAKEAAQNAALQAVGAAEDEVSKAQAAWEKASDAKKDQAQKRLTKAIEALKLANKAAAELNA